MQFISPIVHSTSIRAKEVASVTAIDKVESVQSDDSFSVTDGEDDDDISKYGTNGIVIVGTVAGMVFAIDPATGEQLWTLHTGMPLVSATPHDDRMSSQRSDKHSVLIPGVGRDSNIYYVDQEARIQKLPASVREIVEYSPFVAEDLMYIGSKQTQVFIVDPKTGGVIKSLTTNRYHLAQEDELCPSSTEIPEGSLFIGRVDYLVRAIDPTTGKQKWNVSTGEFIYSFYPNRDADPDDILQLPSIYTSPEGSVYSIDPHSKIPLWEFFPPSRAVSGYAVLDDLGAQPIEFMRNRDNTALALTDRLIIEKMSDNGHLYALENPKFNMEMLANSKKEYDYLALPSKEADTERACDRFHPDFPNCLLGLHNVSFDYGMSVRPMLPAYEQTPRIDTVQVSFYWYTILALGTSLAVVLVTIGILIYQRRKSPPKPKKKKKQSVKEKNEEKSNRIGKLELTGTILGYGSSGTIVYEGILEGRRVAVKRMLAAFYKLAQREVELLLESDAHPNVVNYYLKEEDREFIYLALSYCPRTLADVIENPDEVSRLSLENLKGIIFELVKGVKHLHHLNIVHMDLKPQNILLDANNNVKITDMGLAKKLDINQSSFSNNGSGSAGWQAPEVLIGKELLDKPKTKITKKVDIFSLGCMIYYIITKSGHPFGDRLARESNIVKGNFMLEGISHLPEATDLITNMIQSEPSNRPSIEEVLKHPFFWTDSQKLLFLKDASDRLEIEKATAQIVIDTEALGVEIFGNDWKPKVDSRMMENLGKYRKYNTACVRDLLRLIRNKAHHYRDLDPEVQQVVGPLPEGFLNYFTSRYPKLFTCIYRIIHKYCSTEPTFLHYFQ